jgi:hypothetical protein
LTQCIQVLELLLSQERVISLLYDRALPPRMSFGGFGGIADIVTAGAFKLHCSIASTCRVVAPAWHFTQQLISSADEEQQVKDLLEKLPGEGFAETDGWLLEDGNESGSP